MSYKHESFSSFPIKNDKSLNAKDQLFLNKGVDPILSSIAPSKQSNQTKISTIAESIAKSLLGGDDNTENKSSDDYSDEEEANHDNPIKESKNRIENGTIYNNKKTIKQEKVEASINTDEKTNTNTQIESSKNLNSSSYEYFEEEEDIDEGKILLQEIAIQQEKEKEKKKKEEEEEKEINEKMRLLEIEIIQPNKEDEKYTNSEDFIENDSSQSKYEIIEEEPEKIEIKNDAQINLNPKELFSSIENNNDLSSSNSPKSSPTHSHSPANSPSPNSASIKNSNKKKAKQTNVQHYSIFDITSPKYDLKTPDIRSSKKFSKMKRKTKSIINVNEIKDQETFRKYLNGELDYPKPQGENYMYYFKQKRHYSSYLSHEEVLDICERLISTPIEKSKYKIENPGDISLIIDELKRLKVESISNGDYSRSKKIDDLINYLRTQYRVIDREMFHKASLQGIERKLDDIKNQILEMHGKMKEEDQQENEKFKANLAELGAKHQNQLQDLENSWKGPEKARKFNKRSATLLNGQYIERNLALIGDYEEANEVHRINKRNERIEARVKHQVLNNSFENARSMMLSEQDKEKERIIKLQDDEKRIKKSMQKKNLEILQKRKAMLETQFEDESSIDNFVAKKFRKDKSTVIPMSIVISGSDELILSKPGTSRDVENLNNFIATPITSPLPLPPLAIKQLKKQKKNSSLKKKTTI